MRGTIFPTGVPTGIPAAARKRSRRPGWGGIVRRCAWLAVLAALAACSDASLQQLSDYGLSQRWAECRDARSPTAAMVQSCRNVQRECLRRAERLGNHLC